MNHEEKYIKKRILYSAVYISRFARGELAHDVGQAMLQLPAPLKLLLKLYIICFIIQEMLDFKISIYSFKFPMMSQTIFVSSLTHQLTTNCCSHRRRRTLYAIICSADAHPSLCRDQWTEIKNEQKEFSKIKFPLSSQSQCEPSTESVLVQPIQQNPDFEALVSTTNIAQRILQLLKNSHCCTN